MIAILLSLQVSWGWSGSSEVEAVGVQDDFANEMEGLAFELARGEIGAYREDNRKVEADFPSGQ
jgi:hypothetical protein